MKDRASGYYKLTIGTSGDSQLYENLYIYICLYCGSDWYPAF